MDLKLSHYSKDGIEAIDVGGEIDIYTAPRLRELAAIGNPVLTIVWNLLSDPEARYQDLGPDSCHPCHGRQRRERDLNRKLEPLTGKTVTLQPLTCACR